MKQANIQPAKSPNRESPFGNPYEMIHMTDIVINNDRNNKL